MKIWYYYSARAFLLWFPRCLLWQECLSYSEVIKDTHAVLSSLFCVGMESHMQRTACGLPSGGHCTSHVSSPTVSSPTQVRPVLKCFKCHPCLPAMSSLQGPRVLLWDDRAVFLSFRPSAKRQWQGNKRGIFLFFSWREVLLCTENLFLSKIFRYCLSLDWVKDHTQPCHCVEFVMCSSACTQTSLCSYTCG